MKKMDDTRRNRAALWVTLIVFTLTLFFGRAQAVVAQQWTTNGNNINNTNTGNVGIGTTNPNGKLDVYGGRIVVQPSASGGFMLINDPTWGNAGLFETTATGDIQLKAYSPSFASPQLFLKNGGHVGIGTTNPWVKLHVASPSTTSHSVISASDSAGNSGNFLALWSGWSGGTPNAPALIWRTGTDLRLGGLTDMGTGTGFSETMRVTSGGNVGIGTMSPAVRLDLLGSNVPFGGHIRIAAPDYGQITFFNSNNLGLNDSGRKASIYYDVASSQLVMMNTNGGSYNGPVLLNPSGGNIGIGTFTPSYRLDVQGGQINASAGLCIAGDCKTAWSQVGGGGGSSQWITAGSNIYYNSGNVGVGTTSAAYRLDVQSSSNIIARFMSTAAAHNQVLIDAPTGFNSNLTLQQGGIPQWYLGNRAANNRFSLIESAGMVEVFSILQNGNVGIGTTSPTTKLHVDGDVTVTGNLAAKYQDIAEWVTSSRAIPAATVVVLDPQKSNQVLPSSQSYDTRVAGVISIQPGIALGEAGDGKVLVATTGRVKVKVDATRAPIQIGDLLVTSDLEGMAMKSVPLTIGGRQIHAPGTLIGKALEPLDKGTGEILVLLSLQ
jgi:hypothetical protein